MPGIEILLEVKPTQHARWKIEQTIASNHKSP
jgi:hypothetical protein